MDEKDLLIQILDDLSEKHLHWTYVFAKTLRENQTERKEEPDEQP